MSTRLPHEGRWLQACRRRFGGYKNAAAFVLPVGLYEILKCTQNRVSHELLQTVCIVPQHFEKYPLKGLDSTRIEGVRWNYTFITRGGNKCKYFVRGNPSILSGTFVPKNNFRERRME